MKNTSSFVTPYGDDFSRIYSGKWDLWSRFVWPFLSKALVRKNIQGGLWLDLCCGCGSLLQRAASHGFTCFGLDISMSQLRHAREKAPSAQLVCGDIRSFPLSKEFNVVTCIFDSINYVLSTDEITAVFENVYADLTSDGLFLFDIKTTLGFRNERSKILRDGQTLVVFESKFNPSSSRHVFRVDGFIQEEDRYRRYSEEHVQRAYPEEIIEQLLVEAGFSFTKHDGESFGKARKTSRRLVYLCEK